MKTKEITPQYLYDKAGKKSFVVLPVEDYDELMEDLHDLAVIAERRNEPQTRLEEFEKELKIDGL